MVTILILEDERRSAYRLQKMIPKYDENQDFKIYHTETISEAKEIISKVSVDILFLDLHLHNEDGFDIFKNILAESFLTIIVSAYSDRAIEAYEYGALDFVPKPVFQERLNLALDRYFLTLRDNVSTKRLVVKTRNKLEIISLKRVLLFSPAGHYTEILLEDGTKKFHNLSLENILKLLPNNFWRIHRKYIVNSKHFYKIYSFPGSKYELELLNGNRLPIGRKYVNKIRTQLSKS